MSDDIVKNLKEPSHWLRILFMLGFAVVLYVVGLVVMVLTLAQILFSLLTGKDNPNLRSLGSSLSRYIFEILMFLTYNSEVRPFPFTPFPVMEPVESDEPVKPFKPAEEPAVDLSAGMHNPYSAEAAAAPRLPLQAATCVLASRIAGASTGGSLRPGDSILRWESSGGRSSGL